MKSTLLLTAIVAACLTQGCATAPEPAATLNQGAPPSDMQINSASAVRLCATGECVDPAHAVPGVQVGADSEAPVIAGHPLTSVVVTQCNLVVAVYMTMPDGRLLRFDRTAEVPAEELVTIAYTATHSERVEVACEGIGAVGFEKHEPA